MKEPIYICDEQEFEGAEECLWYLAETGRITIESTNEIDIYIIKP